MTVVMSFQGMMRMPVGGFVLTVDVGMAMGVGMLVGVDLVPVGVLMGMAVAMLMGVLQRNGILYHQHRCHDHNG